MESARINDELDERGFTIIPGLIASELLHLVEEIAHPLLAEQTEEERQKMRSLGSLISVFRAPAFASLIADRRLLSRLEALGFFGLRFSAGYVIRKPPRSPQSFWHQDWGFWDDPISYEPRAPQASLLFYTTDVSPTNGCPRFLPGSHRRRSPLHDELPRFDAAALRRMDDPDASPFQSASGEISVPLKRGDAILFDPRVLHAAHANDSDADRIGLVMWYYRDFDRLPESIRAFAASGDPIADWPEAHQREIRALLPTYSGSAPKAELQKFRMKA